MSNPTLPSIFINQMKDLLGVDYPDFESAFSQDVPKSIRFNMSKGKRHSLKVLDPVPWAIGGYYVDKDSVFTADPHFHAGEYYVQEASSMFVGYVFDLLTPSKSGLKVLDLCAAPGGKSTDILNQLQGDSLLICNELIRNRNQVLVENLLKWGRHNVWITHTDAQTLGALDEYFDIIVIDAPCSGEGMFRKDPLSIQEWSQDSVDMCAVRQFDITKQIYPALKKDGYILYSTCTYNSKENDENIQKFIHNLDLQPVFIDLPSEMAQKPIKTKFGWQFYPHVTQGEGFYLACLQKTKESSPVVKLPYYKEWYSKTSKSDLSTLHQAIHNYTDYDFFVSRHGIQYACPKVLVDDFKYLSKHFYFTKSMVELGKVMKNELIPAHELALQSDVKVSYPTIDLDLYHAQVYLEKNDIGSVLSVNSFENGWYIVTFEGSRLGFAKVIGNRINNYIPKNMRVLKDFKEY
jgi:16S rRNA C967 or C1407 C5-methylase (RsmB/RsmF family)/NOL1/NOP2/fmu family ribosome biogenesis protein